MSMRCFFERRDFPASPSKSISSRVFPFVSGRNLLLQELQKNHHHPFGWRRPLLFSASSYCLAGAKESANALAFGVPTPVTLSQPLAVFRLESVPNEMAYAVS
jgi:hypothetical protein